MARPLFWLGIPTATTAVVIVRAATDGTVTVNCNGGAFTETAATATNDGLVKITITGLSEDSKYSYTVTTPNGDSGGNILKTFPSSGQARVINYSCSKVEADVAQIAIRQADPHCVVCLGDISYFANGTSFGGVTAGNLNGGSEVVSEYHTAYRANFLLTKFREMIETIPFALVPDDHEFDINNAADNSVTDAIANTLAEAAEDYQMGNPVSPYPTVDNNQFYFSFTCGNLEVFVLSACIHGHDATDASAMMRDAVGAGNGCYGRDGNTNQEDWLLAGLVASGKPFKLILSPKMSLKSTNVNSDSWSTYSTEMDRVLQAVHDSGVTGIMWGGGDWHSPGIHRATNGVDASTYDHVMVNACSLYGEIRDAGAASVYSVYRYQGTDNYHGDAYYTGLHGLSETTDSEIKTSIRNQSSKTLCWATVEPGANAMADTSENHRNIVAI